MAKLTKKDIIERIQNVDINFLADVSDAIANDFNRIKELQEAYEKSRSEEEAVSKVFNEKHTKIEEKIKNINQEVEKLMKDNFETTAWWVGDGTVEPDSTWLAYRFVIYGRAIVDPHDHSNNREYFNMSHTSILIALVHLRDELEDNKKKYDEYLNDPEVAEYIAIKNELESNNENLDQKEKNKLIKKLAKKRKLNLRSRKIKNFKKFSKNFGINDLKIYNRISKVIPQLEEIAVRYDNLYKELFEIENKYKDHRESFKSGEMYNEIETIKNRINTRDPLAKEFLLTKLYIENANEFKDAHETLLMIYEQYADQNFLKNLKYNLKAYKHAHEVAQAEGKDFNAMGVAEQYKYYCLAKKAVMTYNKYELDDDHEHK